jgi:hypothetical protein
MILVRTNHPCLRVGCHNLLEICNLWVSLSGSGKTSAWTLLWVYHAPHGDMTLYGSLWIARWSMPTSCKAIHFTHCLWFQRPSSLIEDLSLLHISGNNYIIALAPILSEAQHTILKLMGRLSEEIKSLKIFFTLVSWMMVQNGINIFH